MMAIASRKLIQIHAAMRRKRVESRERACMVKSYHGGLPKGCACRHAFEEVPMTGVMPLDEGMHGSRRQVVTGFTLGFWRENINSMSLRAAALVLPWHRPPGQVWRRSNLHVVEGDCFGQGQERPRNDDNKETIK